MKIRLQMLLEKSKWSVIKRGTQSKPLIARQQGENNWHREWGMWIKYLEPDARVIRLSIGIPHGVYELEVKGKFSFHESEYNEVVPLVLKAFEGDSGPLNQIGVVPVGGWSERKGGNWWSQKGEEAYIAQMVARGEWPPNDEQTITAPDA